MKKFSIYMFTFLTLVACKKDDPMLTIKSDITPAVVNAPADQIITANNLNNQLVITWSPVDYGVTTEITYTVQLDSKCNSFANPIPLGTSNSASLSVSLDNLNTLLQGTLKAAPHQAAELQVRVTSVINGKFLTVSDPVVFKVTPYSSAPLALWMGENSASAPTLYATGSSTYEGYVYVTAGTSFRFTNNRICADSVFGYAGTANQLSVASSSGMITMPNTGYYKVNVDTRNLTFDTLAIRTWGMIGTATAGGWDTSTPLTYDLSRNVWSATVTLTSGALKFRANDGWDLNYGPISPDSLAGTLISTNDAITITDVAEYTVTIDFSKTKSPYQYKYSVVKSANVPEPAKLWLPGGYQNYDPASAPFIYAISDYKYEGYVYINNGTGFKFTSAPDWNHINYGYGGSPGVLSTDGLAVDLSLNIGGYYFFQADVQNLTYNTTLVNTWGAIGTATAGQWDTSTPLTYNQANNVWTATMDLVPGAIKFRANDGWDLNYGPSSSSDLIGTLITTNDAVTITEAGNYTVTLDFSRAVVPYQYTYKIRKN